VLVGVIGGSGLYHLDNLTEMCVVLVVDRDGSFTDEKLSAKVNPETVRTTSCPGVLVRSHLVAVGSPLFAHHYLLAPVRREGRVPRAPRRSPLYRAFLRPCAREHRRAEVARRARGAGVLGRRLAARGDRAGRLRSSVADHRPHERCTSRELFRGHVRCRACNVRGPVLRTPHEMAGGARAEGAHEGGPRSEDAYGQDGRMYGGPTVLHARGEHHVPRVGRRSYQHERPSGVQTSARGRA
jgi:hypothetical protein